MVLNCKNTISWVYQLLETTPVPSRASIRVLTLNDKQDKRKWKFKVKVIQFKKEIIDSKKKFIKLVCLFFKIIFIKYDFKN